VDTARRGQVSLGPAEWPPLGYLGSMSTNSTSRGLQGFVVGALVVGVIAAGLFLSRPSEQVSTMPSAPMAAPVQPPVPPAPASPSEAADLLFNEAMMASAQEDSARLAQVLPGAIAAYRALGELDADDTYHLALLELEGGNLAEARAAAGALLAKNPNHLLGLSVSLRAAVKAGDATSARDVAQRLLQAYDTESVRPLPEYQEHRRVLSTLREEATAATR
jgi:hypothetical protein